MKGQTLREHIFKPIYPKLILLLICCAFFDGAYGQETFSVKGLYFENDLSQIYEGNFSAVSMERTSTKFVIIFNAYLNANAMGCGVFLPSDKVEIFEPQCKSEKVITDQYGIATHKVCSKWEWVGTGRYADPKLYEAKLFLDTLKAGTDFRDMFHNTGYKDPPVHIKEMHKNSRRAEQDMAALFLINACDKPGLQQFAENIGLFALGTPSVQETLNAEERPFEDGPTGDQNFLLFLEDLIREQSKRWVNNTYIVGSTSNVQVSNRDSKGRPSELLAAYGYRDFSGQNTGTVRLTFINGIPDCLYFSDFPGSCRTPSSRIVMSYTNGFYQR